MHALKTALALLACICLAACGETPQPAAPATATATQTSTATPAEGSSSDSTSTTLALGDTYASDTVTVRVLDHQAGVPIYYSAGDIVLAEICLSSSLSTFGTASTTSWYAVGASGGRYVPTFSRQPGYPVGSPEGDLSPGECLQGWMGFEVGEDRLTSIVYAPQGTQQASWRLA